MMNQANAHDQDDLFTTGTAGLPGVARQGVIGLHDGDRLDLRIGPVRKNIGGAELRMLSYNGSIPIPNLHVDQGSEGTVQVRNDGDVEAIVHWHGLRLDNRYGVVPRETQARCHMAEYNQGSMMFSFNVARDRGEAR
jgi:FtsP/CotA-like multicopper oxidase with cupredoxin domain